MYQYHYDVMLPKYGIKNLKLAYMDTDSFIYEVKTKDLFDDMLAMLEYLDTSDYPPSHPCFSVANKKVLGKFKDEMMGKIISAFAGLRAKMYALKIDTTEIKKAKGIQNAALKKSITFSDYVDCLEQNSCIRTKVRTIQSKEHQISTIVINKLSLNPFDDKRIILDDGISTRAIGYA